MGAWVAGARVFSLGIAWVAMSVVLSGRPASAQGGPGVVTVVIETTMGDVTAEIYAGTAPITAENFLSYTDDEVFDGGSFYRSVRMNNQPGDSVRIEVIQAGPDVSRNGQLRDAIPLERTSMTGLRHVDGQGFAVFGQVVDGMDVVRTIQRQPVEAQQLREPVRIVRVRRS